MLAWRTVKQIKGTVRAHQKQKKFPSQRESLNEGNGSLILVRRQTNHADEPAYGPCPGYLGYYMKTDLWKHQKYFCVRTDNFKKCH